VFGLVLLTKRLIERHSGRVPGERHPHAADMTAVFVGHQLNDRQSGGPPQLQAITTQLGSLSEASVSSVLTRPLARRADSQT
jgi:hypothetical protein